MSGELSQLRHFFQVLFDINEADSPESGEL